MDGCSETARYGSGLISAMVSYNMHPEELTRVIELIDASEERANHDLLLMSRDKDREASSRGGLLPNLPRPAKAGDGQEKQVEGKRCARNDRARKQYDQPIFYQGQNWGPGNYHHDRLCLPPPCANTAPVRGELLARTESRPVPRSVSRTDMDCGDECALLPPMFVTVLLLCWSGSGRCHPQRSPVPC